MFSRWPGVPLVLSSASDRGSGSPPPASSDELARQYLAAIIEWSDDAIVGEDLDAIVRTWNRAAERQFGYRADEIVGRSIEIIIPADRHGEEAQLLARIRRGERVDRFETVRVRKDGSTLDVAITMSPVRDGAGTIVGASKILRDVTDERRQAQRQQELLDGERASRAEAVAARDRLAFLAAVSATLGSSLDYERTLDHAVHLALPRLGDYCTVMVVDDNAALRLVACGHVDRGQEPIIRAIAQRFVEMPSDVPTFTASIASSGQPRLVPRVLDSPEYAQVRRIMPEQTVVPDLFKPLSFAGAPLLAGGRTIGVISFGTMADASNREFTIDDLMLIEEFAARVSVSIENARLFRQAAEVNRLKDEFLATLSHELRTPLNAILGWSKLLADGRLKDEAMQKAIVAIERNATAQAKLVDDILDLARGVAGNLRLDVSTVDLADIAQRGVDAITPAAAARHITIDVAVAPTPIVGDSGRLAQVIDNLLSNAVKFTPDGGRVSVSVSERDGQAVLAVADSGIGIAANFLPFVFDKFRQGDGSHTRRYGGLGLGLAIVRHLVELHGGTVEARSDGKDKGSTFTVRLPIKRRPF